MTTPDVLDLPPIHAMDWRRAQSKKLLKRKVSDTIESLPAQKYCSLV